MEGKETTAPDRDGLRRTGDPPTVNNSHPRPTTRKTQGPGRTNEKRQSKTRASQSRYDGRDGRYMELDDDDNSDKDSNSGRKDDDERNKGIK